MQEAPHLSSHLSGQCSIWPALETPQTHNGNQATPHEHHFSYKKWGFLSNLKKWLIGTAVSEKLWSPGRQHPTPASVLHHVLPDQQHGLTKKWHPSVWLLAESKNITKIVLQEKHFKNSDKNKTQWHMLGRRISTASKWTPGRHKKGSWSEGRGFINSPRHHPTSSLSRSAVLRPRSDGEKPTRENPVWKECICC